MNFYKHYIGDFQRDTGHLSLTERGAYLSLMHHYYATEKPLPADHAALCRIAGAITKVERDAVKAVMAFFERVESGLMHNRIEAELHKAGEIANTNRDIAVAREAKRRAEREAREEHEACTNRATNVPRIEHEQSTHQTPDTRHQEEKEPPTEVVGKPAASRPPDCPTQILIDLYHEHLPMLPRVEVINDTRKRALSARWRDVVTDADIRKSPDVRTAGIEWFAWFFSHCAKSRFLTGKAKDWRADLDFLLTPSKFARAVEGAYHKETA